MSLTKRVSLPLGIEKQLPARIFAVEPEASISVCEVDRAIPLDDDIVWAIQTLAFVAVGQNRALAVLLAAHQRAPSEGGDD
jgi:hypothetical protein